MMEQKYRHMMEQVNMDEDFASGLLERIQEGQPKRRHRPLRTALIAACVCLALTGTAVAVSSGVLVRFIQGDEGLGSFADVADHEVDGYYEVTTDYRFSLDVFSEELLAAASQGNGDLVFDSWEAAEEFVGFNVLDNAVLQGKRMVETIAANGATGRCLVRYFNDPDSGDLSVVRIRANYYLSDFVSYTEKIENGILSYSLPATTDTVSIMATLVTEGNPYRTGGGRFFTYDEEDLDQVSVEEYTISSETAATILRDPTWEVIFDGTPEEQAEWEEAYSDVVYYTAYLDVGGAMVEVEMHTSETLDEAQCLATLKEILDAFE